MSWDKTSSKKCVTKSSEANGTPKMHKPLVTKVHPWRIFMHGKIPNGLQSLHFDILTLSLTRANWVERWLKTWVISLKGLMIWVSWAKNGKTQLVACVIKEFDNGPKQIKDLLVGHLVSCLKMTK
jgi:hypothetical protein